MQFHVAQVDHDGRAGTADDDNRGEKWPGAEADYGDQQITDIVGATQRVRDADQAESKDETGGQTEEGDGRQRVDTGEDDLCYGGGITA